MTSSDAPQPPGGPLRQDAPEGGLAPDAEREELPSSETRTEAGPGATTDLPSISHGDEQDESEADLQEENAETSLDQPSQ